MGPFWCRDFQPSTAWVPSHAIWARSPQHRPASVFMSTGQSGTPGYTAVMIVPTGIGAAIGGYAGDALPAAKVLASVVDTLVTHPNVMNGASLYWPEGNMLYAEGYALDEFCAGRWGLLPTRKRAHRIGLVLDSGMSEASRLRHLQAAEAARATLGIDVAAYCMTDAPIGVTLAMSSGGASWGTVSDPHTAVRAARKLIAGAGCTAIAVVAQFPDEEDEAMLMAYRQGQGVDAVGGAEAIISHLLVQELGVPCAHAPSLTAPPLDPSVSPKACAEELGHTFLPCVLANLHRAPGIVTWGGHPDAAIALWAKDVDVVVVPADACGGPGVLSLAQRGVLVVAVEDNKTAMRAGARNLGMEDVAHARSYVEAVGLVAAHKAGVMRGSLEAEVHCLQHL